MGSIILFGGNEMKWRRNRKLPKVNLPKIKWPLRLLLYVITVIFSLLSMIIVYFNSVAIAISSIIYAIAACGIGLSGCYLYQDLTYGINEKLKTGIEANPFANRITKDYQYRTVLSTYSSLIFNLVFALSNGIFGVIYDSVWFGSLSAYYIVLSIMRFIVVQYDRKNSKIEKTQKMKQKELSVYQNCGILFLLLTVALGAAVMQMVYLDKSHSYPGTLIFAVAAYTFYKIIIAIINKVKAGRLKSPLLMTIRDVGYADALVSMLSLQTAMFVSFGSGEQVNRRIMNSMTGGAVCMMIFIMGVYMIVTAQKQKSSF
jgi:hypothetical protein